MSIRQNKNKNIGEKNLYGYSIRMASVLRDAATGAAVYGGTMVLLGVVSGTGLELMKNAMGGLVMGGAIMADNVTHSMLMMQPSVASSAVVTGGWFALLESVLSGDTNYGRNAIAGAATSVVVDTFY
jgi:hypothetical protein